jgi:hypothetical protein
MKLTVPGSKGYIPSVDGNDLVRDAAKTDDRQDVTVWLLDRLHELNTRAKQIVSDHLATIRPPEADGVGYSTTVKRRKGT